MTFSLVLLMPLHPILPTMVVITIAVVAITEDNHRFMAASTEELGEGARGGGFHGL
jgi:hypothetical protein